MTTKYVLDSKDEARLFASLAEMAEKYKNEPVPYFFVVPPPPPPRPHVPGFDSNHNGEYRLLWKERPSKHAVQDYQATHYTNRNRVKHAKVITNYGEFSQTKVEVYADRGREIFHEETWLYIDDHDENKVYFH